MREEKPFRLSSLRHPGHRFSGQFAEGQWHFTVKSEHFSGTFSGDSLLDAMQKATEHIEGKIKEGKGK